MAKLEDQVMPSELLDDIRSSAKKSELIKKYRTSDRELAVMLHALYRKGEMSKEEFNDFFKGVELRRVQPSPGLPEVAVPVSTTEQAPPSEILASLTAAAARELSEEPSADPAHVSPAVEPAPTAAEAPEPASTAAEASEPTPQGEGPPPEVTKPSVTEKLPDVEPEPATLHRDIQERLLSPGIATAAGRGTLDSAGVASVLDTMLERLNSIEGRLAEIEKQLKTH